MGIPATVQDELDVVFARLLAADVEHADATELVGAVAGAQRIRAWLDAFDVRCVNRNRDLHPVTTERAGRERDRSLLTGSGRRSGRDARDTANRADTCEKIPQLGKALSDGDATGGHVDAVTRAAAGLDDDTKQKLAEHGDEIAAAARDQSPEELGRTCQDLIRRLSDDDGAAQQERLRAQRRCSRRRDLDTGMDLTTLALDPLTSDKVWAAINTAIATAHAQRQADDDRTWEQFKADVVVDLITGKLTITGTGRPEIVVLVDFDTLVNGPHPDTTCETSAGSNVPVCTLRRWLCDADLLPVTLNGDGIALDVGRSSRTATSAQRSALRAMYPTCAFPGCTVGFDDCRIHHVVYWRNHGGSDLHNLLPLCEHHHHLVHEGGWALTVSSGRIITIIRPDGTRHFHGTTHRHRPRPKPCHRPRPAGTSGRDDPTGSPAATGPPNSSETSTAASEPTGPSTAETSAADDRPTTPDPSAHQTDHAAPPAELLDPLLDETPPTDDPSADDISRPVTDPEPASRDAERPAHIQAVHDLAQRAAERAARRANRSALPDTG